MKKTIIKKAIEKAEKNGYVPPHTWETDGFKITFANPYEIIFSHRWAKAFWGEGDMHEVDGNKLNDKGDSTYYTLKVWQYHLQQLVLCEKHLKYIEKFL